MKSIIKHFFYWLCSFFKMCVWIIVLIFDWDICLFIIGLSEFLRLILDAQPLSYI